MTDAQNDPATIPVFRALPADSDTAIVAFSGLGIDRDRFHFFGIERLFPDWAKLLVRDPSENWYNAGLPGVGETVEEIAAGIERELARLGARRVMTVGSSMGGYAAALYGCMIGAERVIAIVPQTLLDPALRRRAPSAQIDLQAADLTPVLSAAPKTKVDVVLGWDDLLDVFHAQRVAHLPSVRILAVPDAGHAFVRRLVKSGEFWPFMGKLIEGRIPPPAELEPALAADVVEQIEAAVFAWGRRDWRAAVAAIAPVANRFPGWSAPNTVLKNGRSRLALASGPAKPPPGFNALDRDESLAPPARPGRIGQLLLGKPWIVHRGSGRRWEIALTFDDGPSPWTTPIAAAFEKHDCRATFFLRGAAVAEQPETVAALAQAGHELANHLWSHADPAEQSEEEIRAEIERTAKAIRAAGRVTPRFVRPPYAKAPEKVARAAQRTGVRAIVLRSIGSSDWAAGAADEIVGPVLGVAAPGGIVCMHDGISPDERDSDSREPTLVAVRQLVPALLERGLKPVTLSQLFR